MQECFNKIISMLFNPPGHVTRPQKRIAFIHPDLGIGGAEQLVVNLCLGAINQGYEAHIYTPYHHKSFPETHDGTIKIHQHGSFYSLIPDTIFGYFKGILAYIRTLVCALWLICYDGNYKAVVCDQVSFVLPFLRLAGHNTVFYCHFPDKLLAGSRKSLLKKIYRFFIDLAEEVSLLFAKKIYVNSEYTKQIFYENFCLITKLKKIEVQILYPAIDFKQFETQTQMNEQVSSKMKQIGDKYFFSLNRYERKKNIALAIEAFAELKKRCPDKIQEFKLVIAGGYDLKVIENIQHKKQLEALASKLSVADQTVFLTSISNQLRKSLLQKAACVLYTPTNEHFGIVPCQAMYCNVPVIADNSGGPKQSVGADGTCGFLIDGGAKQWAEKMEYIVNGKQKFDKGKQKMIKRFGLKSFGEQFVEGINSVSEYHPRRKKN